MAFPSFPGGAAAKGANDYELAWTVDSLLDLLAGEVDELHLEPQGRDGLGVEFYRVLPSGEREFHSVKRQAPASRSGWTPALLTQQQATSGRSILKDLFGHLARDDAASAVFISQDSAPEMRELAERTRSVRDLWEFRQSLSKEHLRVFETCAKRLERDESDLYQKLRQSSFTAIGHHELVRFTEAKIPALIQRVGGSAADPSEVRLRLGEFAWNHLGRPVTRSNLRRELQKHGFCEQPLAKNARVRSAISDRNAAYMRRVQKTLVNDEAIPRSQAFAIADTLINRDHSLLLAGSAGEGKSCLVAQVIDYLRDADIPLLALSMDEMAGVVSASDLGSRLGLPSSPAIVLGQVSAGKRAVLCIDQLDAISFVSGRNPQGQSVLDELIGQASRYPQLRLLLACRTFDLHEDDSLARLESGTSLMRRIDVEELSVDDVHGALATAGMDPTTDFSESQIEILRVPLHLHLLLRGGRARDRFTSPQDLFDRYWNEKRRRVDQLAGSGAFRDAMKRLADRLSASQQLQAPRRDMTGHEGTLETMASEAVVFIHDDSVWFFHEAFFDYAFAKTFLQDDTDLVEWLIHDEQTPFRRSQVRQVLAFLREPRGNRRRYLRTVEDLLRDERVRFHIKKLVLDWLGAVPDPTEEEWRVLERLATDLAPHVWSAIRGSVPWFDLLDRQGLLASRLSANDEETDRVVTLLQAPEVLAARATEVAGLVSPFLGQSDSWRNRLWRIAHGGKGYASLDMQELLIRLVTDGPGSPADQGMWSVLQGLSTEEPAFAAKVLGAWFDRQVEQALRSGHEVPDLDADESRDMMIVRHISEHVIGQCAKLDPREFVHQLYPRLIRLDGRASPQPIYGPGPPGGTREQLQEALRQAMSALSQDDPAALNAIMDPDFPTGTECTRWMSALFLRVWSANPAVYADRIARFLLEAPEVRLLLRYDIHFGQHRFLSSGSDHAPDDDTSSPVAISRGAVKAASSSCSDALHAELENAILTISRKTDGEAQPSEAAELALLRALDAERSGAQARHRIAELERQTQAPGTPEAPSASAALLRRLPLSPEDRKRVTDDEWLPLMAEHPEHEARWNDSGRIYSAMDIAQELTAATHEDPERFATLTDRMDSSHAAIYFGAILGGLTRREAGAGRAGTLGQVCSLLRKIAEMGMQVRGCEIAWAIDTLGDEALPNDIIEMLCSIAVDDPDPPSDNWQDSPSGKRGTEAITQAINSSRGAAAMAIAHMLFADADRWRRLKPTVDALITDRVLAVRAVAVRCLLAILDVHRSDAFAGFQKLVEDADDILSTDDVEEFMSYAIARDYAAIRPIADGMLTSASVDTVRSGARLLTAASLRLDEARGDGDRMLTMTEAARAGAAEVYARNVGAETVGPECERRLRILFEDESDIVRKEAVFCWGSSALSPEQVASRRSLITAFAQSPAFDAHSVKMLTNQLMKVRGPLPVELCDVAERALERFGDKLASIQFSEAAVGFTLSRLLARLLDDTCDPALRTRILDAIDGMQRAGVPDIEDQLGERYDR